MSHPPTHTLTEHILFPYKRLNTNRLASQLSGKTVLITGASHGIGEALAYLLAFPKVNLILVGRTTEKLHEVKKRVEEKHGNASIFAADLRNTEELNALLNFIHTHTQGIDILINNAGKSIHRSIAESLDRFHDFTRTMSINYFVPVQIALALVPELARKKGHIINVSAINTLLLPAPGWAAYQASKSAFDNWFRCAAPELRAQGIACTSIYLPLVRTRMIAPTLAYSSLPAMNPNHVARIIARYILSRKQNFVPWWLFPIQLASVLFRRPAEYVLFVQEKRKQARLASK